MDNGETAWKVQRDRSFDVRINPYQNQCFFTYAGITNEKGNQEQISYKCDITTGEIKEFLRAKLSSGYISPIGVGGIIYITEVPSSQNLLLVTYAEPLPNWEVNSFFGLYNTETNTWVWDRKLLSAPNQNTSVFTPPQIYNNRIYANVGYSIVCHDLLSGEQVWKKDFSQDFMFSGFIIAKDENKLIGNCEDLTTYCLDPATGDIIWKTPGSGTSSAMSYLNGVVYFVGGSTAFLHAVDVQTGKTLWRIDASKLGGEEERYGFKTNAVYVFPAGNGEPAKVIALSHLYAYCFKAYR